jgi:ribosomal protein S8
MSLVQAPIHDLLIRIKNAYLARRYQVENVQYSKFKQNMLDLLKLYRFIDGYKIVTEGNKQFFTIDLRVT